MKTGSLKLFKIKKIKLAVVICILLLLIIIIISQTIFIKDITRTFNLEDKSKAATLTSGSMPLVSRGLKTYSLNNSSGHTSNLANDDNYYSGSTWQPSSLSSWISFDLSTLPVAQRNKILFAWWTPWSQLYDRFNDQAGIPYNYTIEINNAAGGGTSSPVTGWISVKQITNNKFGMLLHDLNINGANWIRMNISSIKPGTTEMPQFNIDLYDTSNGNTESWLLIGDSITSMSATPSGSVQPGSDSIPTLINASYPNNYPNFSDGGMSGSSLSEALNLYLDDVLTNYDAKYISLNFGTNGGITFADLDTAVQKIIYAGKVPVLPWTMMWSEDTTIQSNFPTYDSITKQIFTKYPQIIKGPDLWNIFKDHTEWMADVLHPNYTGQQVYRKAWADAIRVNVYSFNTSVTSTTLPTYTSNPTITPVPTNSPVATTSVPFSGNWVNIDPAGVSNNHGAFGNNNYGFNSIVLDPANPSTIYIGTNYQGLWKSSDKGSTWTKVNTGTGGSMLDSGRMWTLAIDPFNSQTLYTTAGYGELGVLKSTDGGKSWMQMFGSDGLNSLLVQNLATNDIYTISLDPTMPNHILATFHYYWHNSGDSGVIESFDGGNSWTVHNPPAGSGWGAGNGVWFANNTKANSLNTTTDTWIFGSQNNGFWITSNGGSTWKQLIGWDNMTHGATEALYRDPKSGILIVAAGTQIQKSIDNGTTWTNIAAGLPYSYYQAVASDGINMFTIQGFPTDTNGTGQWYSKTVNGTENWSPYGNQKACDPAGYCNGPVMTAYDSINSIIYTVNWNGGVWKLQTQKPISTTTVIPNSCSCQSNNLCSSSYTFPSGNSNAGLSCSSEIGTPTQSDKNGYCTNELRTKGDANTDGVINSLDYIYYVRIVNGGTVPTKINADFNGDGVVSPSDRTIVVQSIPK